MKRELFRSFTVFFLSIVLITLPTIKAYPFGFNAHRKINRMAVFTLPPEMVGFFRKHIEYITEQSIQPDRLAHAIPGEAPRHYIDIDQYGENPFATVPKTWTKAVEKFSEDTLMAHGVLPWHINVMMMRLTRAFESGDVDRILYNAAHIGHYIADACTPLHTTKYYNGRTPDEVGIHGFWESRLPELYADGFNYFVGRAEYIEYPLERTWELVKNSHLKVDTIYQVFNDLRLRMGADRVFSHESRGNTNMRVYSRDFSRAFHEELKCMVERQMKLATKSVGDFWYTAWVNAGQPELSKVVKAVSEDHLQELEEEKKKFEQTEKPQGRYYPQ